MNEDYLFRYGLVFVVSILALGNVIIVAYLINNDWNRKEESP